MPESLEGAPAVEDLLDEDAHRYLQCEEQMLKPEGAPPEGFKPYWDPRLRNNEKMYKRLIQKLRKAKYLVYTQTPKSFCGPFFVKKSDGKRIRMIIDARGTNCMFKPPPGLHLLTSDGFSRIELSPPVGLFPGDPDFEHWMQQHKLSIGLSDVKDCFHRLRQPHWLSEYFCLKGIPAEWVQLDGTHLNGQYLKTGACFLRKG